jgi:hypothetical protein
LGVSAQHRGDGIEAALAEGNDGAEGLTTSVAFGAWVESGGADHVEGCLGVANEGASVVDTLDGEVGGRVLAFVAQFPAFAPAMLGKVGVSGFGADGTERVGLVGCGEGRDCEAIPGVRYAVDEGAALRVGRGGVQVMVCPAGAEGRKRGG